MARLTTSSRRRPFAVLLGLMTALVAVVLVQTGPASGASPKPVTIVVDGVSGVTAPDGTPAAAVPTALVEAGQPFSVQVSFYDSEGQPASFNKDTTLAITANGAGPGNTPGPATGVAPAKETSATLTTSLPLPANQVSITVSAPGLNGSNAVAPGTSAVFDVLADIELYDAEAGVAFSQGIGGARNCTEATEEKPVCGVLMLPNGAASSQVLLSQGRCDTTYGGCTSPRGSVIQALADLESLYTTTAPATILVKCDKSLCGNGSLKDVRPGYSLLGNAPLQPAPDCPSKGTLGEDQEVCVDYVQSNRDNAGDSLLYLLFTKDARVSAR
jgi:hypothetical protein